MTTIYFIMASLRTDSTYVAPTVRKNRISQLKKGYVHVTWSCPCGVIRRHLRSTCNLSMYQMSND